MDAFHQANAAQLDILITGYGEQLGLHVDTYQTLSADKQNSIKDALTDRDYTTAEQLKDIFNQEVEKYAAATTRPSGGGADAYGFPMQILGINSGGDTQPLESLQNGPVDVRVVVQDSKEPVEAGGLCLVGLYEKGVLRELRMRTLPAMDAYEAVRVPYGDFTVRDAEITTLRVMLVDEQLRPLASPYTFPETQ